MFVANCVRTRLYSGVRLTRLRTIREAKGIGREDFARMAGVALKTVERWESGAEIDVKTSSLRAIKSALGVSSDADLTGEDGAVSPGAAALEEWRATTSLPKPVSGLARRTAETLVEQWPAIDPPTAAAIEQWMAAWWAKQPRDRNRGVDTPDASQRQRRHAPAPSTPPGPRARR